MSVPSRASALRSFGAEIALFPVLTLVACQPPVAPPQPPATLFVHVRTRLAMATTEDRGAEVTPTARYQQMRTSINKVAVVAPTSCLAESSSQDANARKQSAWLETECGVNMSEIERLLSARAYAVVSWRTMAQHRDRLPKEVAEQLGAQVLFQINSFEPQENAAGRVDGQIVREFFNSDPFGTVGSAMSLYPADLEQIRLLSASREQFLRSRPPPEGVILDLAAIDVKTGENIWFYRWTKISSDATSATTKMLVRGDPHSISETNRDGETSARFSGYRWSEVQPQPLPTAMNAPAPVQSTREQIEGTIGTPDARRRIRWGLFREIVADFVSRFRDGR